MAELTRHTTSGACPMHHYRACGRCPYCGEELPRPLTHLEHETARRMLLAEHYKRRLDALTDEDVSK